MIIIPHTELSEPCQTELTFSFSIPLNTAHPSKVSVTTSPLYISVNFAPHFFELDLVNSIVGDESGVVVGEGLIVFTLVKSEGVDWDLGNWIFKGPKPILAARRAASQTQQLELEAKKRADRLLLKRETERNMVKHQMTAEREAREVVENKKKDEENEARRVIMEWAESGSLKASVENVNEIEEIDEEMDNVKIAEADNQIVLELADDDSSDSDIDLELLRANIKKKLAPRQHAPPRSRSTAIVNVSFTSRGQIPTSAARETEDNKWTERIKHMDQAAMMDKAKGFYTVGNFEGAVNAYSEVIKAGPYATALSNRSACYMRLEKYNECIKDCTEALGVGEGVQVKMYARRGFCYEKIKEIQNALSDYRMAVMLDPSDEGLQRDLDQLLQAVGDAEPRR